MVLFWGGQEGRLEVGGLRLSNLLLCVSVCPVKIISFNPRLLSPASVYAYRKYYYYDKCDVWISLKGRRKKVIVRNAYQYTFVETRRISRWKWSVPTDIDLT